MCMCAFSNERECVCVCGREREGEKERQRESGRGTGESSCNCTKHAVLFYAFWSSFISLCNPVVATVNLPGNKKEKERNTI